MVEIVDNVAESPRATVPKDEWVNAFIAGNAAMPVSSPAINILMLSSVLEAPPEDWSQFAYSQLSEDQVARVQKKMTEGHSSLRHSNTNASDAVREVKQVTDENIRDVWSSLRALVFNKVFEYSVYPNDPRFLYKKGIYAQVPFVQKAARGDGFESLRKAVLAAREALRSSESLALQRDYRATVLRLGRDGVYEEERRDPEGSALGRVKSHLAADIDRRNLGPRETELMKRMIGLPSARIAA